MSQFLFMNFKRDNEFVYDSSEEEEELEKEEREEKSETEEKEEEEEESEKEEINNKIISNPKSITSSKRSSIIKNNSSISDNYSENSYSSLFDSKNSIVEEKNNEDNNKLLEYIIGKDNIINTILISRNVSFLKKANEKIINYNILNIIDNFKKQENMLFCFRFKKSKTNNEFV